MLLAISDLQLGVCGVIFGAGRVMSPFKTMPSGGVRGRPGVADRSISSGRDRPTTAPRRPRPHPRGPGASAGCPPRRSTRRSRPTPPAGPRSPTSSGCRAEQKQLGKLIAAGPGRGEGRAAGPHQDARRGRQERRGRPDGRPSRTGATRSTRSPTRPPRSRRPAARTTTSCSRSTARRATSRRRGSSPATTSSSAASSGRSTSSAARRCPARGSTTSPAPAPTSSSRWSTWRWTRPASAGFTTMIPPTLVKPRAMEGTGFLGQAADDVYRIEGQDIYLVGTSRGAARGVPLRRDPRRRDVAAALRRVQPLLPQGGRLARQGHAGDHPRALVRQGGDVLLHDARGVRGRAPAPARLGAGVARQARAGLPRHRRRRRRPRPLRPAQVRLRGVGADPGPLPRADLDLQLHRLPDPAPRHPGPLPATAARRRSGRSPPSTARSWRSRAPSWRSSRPTSRPTGPCGSRRRCSPTCRAARSSNPS